MPLSISWHGCRMVSTVKYVWGYIRYDHCAQRLLARNYPWTAVSRKSWGEGKNFFSREKRFFPSPQTPHHFSRKAGYFPLRCRGIKIITSLLAQASASRLPKANSSHCKAILHDGWNPSLHISPLIGNIALWKNVLLFYALACNFSSLFYIKTLNKKSDYEKDSCNIFICSFCSQKTWL